MKQMKKMIKIKCSYNFIWACAFGFITCAFGVFHVIHDVNQDGLELFGNYTTATITECILLCEKIKRCHSTLEWADGKCVLLTHRKKTVTPDDGPLIHTNKVKAILNFPNDVIFDDDLSFDRKTCCHWGEFTPCSVSCDGGIRLRTRTCFTGKLEEIEKDIQPCNEDACPCIWKNTDLPEGYLDELRTNNWGTCQRSCAAKSSCVSWLWFTEKHRWHKLCLLKGYMSPEKMKPSEHMILGLKNCTRFPN